MPCKSCIQKKPEARRGNPLGSTKWEVGSTKLEDRRPKTEDGNWRHCEECLVNLVFRKKLMHDVAILLERSWKWEVGCSNNTSLFIILQSSFIIPFFKYRMMIDEYDYTE